MPDSIFSLALAQFDPDVHASLKAKLALLDPQIEDNLKNETALSLDLFISLLNDFLRFHAESNDALSSWKNACYGHVCSGKQVPDDMLPILLGRARTVAQVAYDIAFKGDHSFDLTDAERYLKEFAGETIVDEAFESSLRACPLGGKLLWATFDENVSANHPFLRLPKTAAGVCAALGLELYENLVAIAWNHEQAGKPALYRPTIADAADFCYFRPHPDANSPFGLTLPRPHDPSLDPQPEVVLELISCNALVLPYFVYEDKTT